MDPITLLPPDDIRRRIAACEGELKALRKLLRASQDAYDADRYRRERAGDPTTTTPATAGGGAPRGAA
jgi:hypothetical protein